MKKYSAILVWGKLKLKPQETTIFSLKWLKIKRLEIARFGKEVEQLQLLCISRGGKCANRFGVSEDCFGRDFKI